MEKGVDLFNAGRYWEAHEAWEQAWIPDRHGPDRGFYKGLIQAAAGCLHYTRRNARGAISKWRSGIGYLRPYLPQHHGLDLVPFVALVEADLAALEQAEHGEWPSLAMPQLMSSVSPPAGGQEARL
jgi:predicted metal-dependent hydrolase